MSRSNKKYAIIKHKTNHKWYNRLFRRINKQRIKNNKEPRKMKEIINDWDVCDWIYNAEHDEDDECYKLKLKRK